MRYHYQRALCAPPSATTIQDVNEEGHKVSTFSIPSRQAYVKVASEQQAKIAQYASVHGNAAAVHQFCKELGFPIRKREQRSVAEDKVTDGNSAENVSSERNGSLNEGPAFQEVKMTSRTGEKLNTK